MIETPFSALVRLAVLDNSVLQSESQKNILKKTYTSFQEQHGSLLEQEASLQAQDKNMRKQLFEAEHEVKALAGVVAKKEHQRNVVANAKEYASLEHELVQARQELATREAGLYDLFEKVEAVAALLPDQQQRILGQIQEVQHKQQVLQQQLHDLEKQLDEYNEQRAVELDRLLPEWRSKYEDLYQMMDNPIVSVVQGACAGCYYSVSVNDLAQLQRHKVLQCKECFRLLYVV